jgi:hypothetical protein
MKELFIAWQDPNTRRWTPVGRLGYWDNRYYFVYTKGAKKSKNFVPFGRMRDLRSVYISDEIFPLFANRILSASRPEYADYIRWLGLNGKEYDNLEVLARSGGIRATDTLEIFPRPVPDAEGKYVSYFFSHGLRYLIPENREHIAKLKAGDRLLLMHDMQNLHDANALLMRTEDPISIVGYCPRYLSSEFRSLIRLAGPKHVNVAVYQVNKDAPNDLRLLCRLDSPWPKKFSPCSKPEFMPMANAEAVRRLKKAARQLDYAI